MEIPDWLPDEAGDSVRQEIAGRDFLLARYIDGWTFVEAGLPGHNGAFPIRHGIWTLTIEKAAWQTDYEFATWNAVERTLANLGK